MGRGFASAHPDSLHYGNWLGSEPE